MLCKESKSCFLMEAARINRSLATPRESRPQYGLSQPRPQPILKVRSRLRLRASAAGSFAHPSCASRASACGRAGSVAVAVASVQVCVLVFGEITLECVKIKTGRCNEFELACATVACL
jgi:hypothetical protein